MAATGQGINILRYSALFFGVFYGITHQSALKTGAEQSKAQHEFQAKQDLISKAKAEWTKKNMPAESKTGDGGVISDPEDPKFDLEAWLTMQQANQAS